jgi:23S rRNA pseudouridine2605 synthase
MPTQRGSGDRRVGLARSLSKLGFCSRSQAWELIQAGRVRVNGAVARDPERRTDWRRERIEVDGQPVAAEARVYLMLNKPRGLVTTASDEQGRATVLERFRGQSLPFVSPVGRLDKASEGLLLFTNDTAWAARITDPACHLDKTYHVQVDCLANDALVRRLQDGATADGEFLAAKGARVLRQGGKNSWLEIVLDEGRNRHIRRLLAALGVNVLRLVRVTVGPLQLGPLAKGQWRHLTRDEVKAAQKMSQAR